MPCPFHLALTADPASGALDEVASSIACHLIGATGQWLQPGAAYEIGIADRSLVDAVAVNLAPRPIDVNVVPAPHRAKRLFVADMESTVIQQEMIDELAHIAGRRDSIAPLTAATMRGERDFVSSLRSRVAHLAGLTTSDLASAAARITPMPGAAALVAAMKANGALTALVTGGFSVFAEPVARDFGFDRVFANTLEIEDGGLTGRVVEPILDAAAKRDILLNLAAGLGLETRDVVAVGDGANDIPMLQSAGLGIAFRAKPAVRAAMRAIPSGAVIDHADLTAVLHLQNLTG